MSDTQSTSSAESTDGSPDSDTEGYVHRPSGEPPRHPQAQTDDFGWRGWVLVGVLVVSFLVVPWALIMAPAAQDTVTGLGLSWRDTYLAVPMIPAILLGAVGVWTALRARQT